MRTPSVGELANFGPAIAGPVATALLRCNSEILLCTVFAQLSKRVCDVTMSCDSHVIISRRMAIIVVALIAMYGERWLA